MKCLVESCIRNGEARHRGFCDAHYKRLLSKGDVQAHIPLRRYVKGTIEERLMAYVVKTDGCWLWEGALDPDGYGLITIDGRTRKVHVLSFVLSTGIRPSDIQPMVLHNCHIRNCIRPEHLRLGDARDNSHDAMEVGHIEHCQETGRFQTPIAR